MKVTKAELKRIIKEEISVVTEDREAHIGGIVKKLVRLKQAVLNAEKGMENMTAQLDHSNDEDYMIIQDIMTSQAYWAKQNEVMNLNDKIELLMTQLEQLKADSPGQLERP